MPFQPQRIPSQPPARLSEFNDRLAALGLAGLSRSEFENLRRQMERERLLRALARAESGDRNAHVYLEKALEQAHAGRTDTVACKSPDKPTATAHQGSSKIESRGASRTRQSIHVYGQKGALTFEPDETRANEPTVTLDAALASGPRQFDWAHKIRVQLTRDELPVVLAVLLGTLPRCEFKNHGPTNDKGFSVEDQGGSFFVRVFARDQGLRAVPLGPTDAFRVAGLLLRQLRAGLPGLSSGDLLLLVRAIIGRLRQSGASTRQNDRSVPQSESTA